jgi:hypothetical protein
MLTILLLPLLLSATGALQAPIPFSDLRTFRCEFSDSEGRRTQEGKTREIKGDKFSEPLIIDNINRKARSARLIGNAGGSDLAILAETKLAITFAEYTDVGGVSILTIFKHAAGFDVHHRAVFSRHLVFTVPEGTLSLGQYYGTCRGQL